MISHSIVDRNEAKIVLTSPSNPPGVIYVRDDVTEFYNGGIEAIRTLAKKKDISKV